MEVDEDSWTVDVGVAFSGGKLEFSESLAEVSEKIIRDADDNSGKFISAAQIGPSQDITDDSNDKIRNHIESTRKQKRRKPKTPAVIDEAESSAKQKEEADMTLKSAMLDIIKFGIASGGLKTDEKADMEKHLAMRLGAKAQKKKAVNYKDFKLIRKSEKAQEKEEKGKLSGTKKTNSKRKDKRKASKKRK